MTHRRRSRSLLGQVADSGRWSLNVEPPRVPSEYGQLVRRSRPPTSSPSRAPEDELDALVRGLKDRQQQTASENSGPSPDPIQQLRELTLTDLVPAFVDLMEKYAPTGISMQMDASNFLEGGREIKFEFGIGDYRVHLHGTVTTEAIAFHETRYTPEMHGELVSGPMLRLRGLDQATFRSFVCERLAILVRSAIRRR